jgi:hypothetical protein
MSETSKNGVFGGPENMGFEGVCLQNGVRKRVFGALEASQTGDLPLGRAVEPSKRRRRAINKGCLQESRRRRHRRKPLWFRDGTDGVRERLSGAAGQAQDKQDGETVFSERKRSKPADYISVETIFEEQDYGKKRD